MPAKQGQQQGQAPEVPGIGRVFKEPLAVKEAFPISVDEVVDGIGHHHQLQHPFDVSDVPDDGRQPEEHLGGGFDQMFKVPAHHHQGGGGPGQYSHKDEQSKAVVHQLKAVPGGGIACCGKEDHHDQGHDPVNVELGQDAEGGDGGYGIHHLCDQMPVGPQGPSRRHQSFRDEKPGNDAGDEVVDIRGFVDGSAPAYPYGNGEPVDADEQQGLHQGPKGPQGGSAVAFLQLFNGHLQGAPCISAVFPEDLPGVLYEIHGASSLSFEHAHPEKCFGSAFVVQRFTFGV